MWVLILYIILYYLLLESFFSSRIIRIWSVWLEIESIELSPLSSFDFIFQFEFALNVRPNIIDIHEGLQERQ